MREAARALDDVSDHLGEVLRRADELLAEWSRFGTQVRAQVESEVAAIGEVIDGAVARAAGAGIDRAVVDRLRALTAELERLEQRTRAASRAVVEHREADRRVLWVVVAGIVLANALLVVLLLRKPEPVPVAEPVRIESSAPSPSLSGGPAPAAGSADAVGASTGSGEAGAQPLAGSNAATTGAGAPATGSAGTGAAAAGSTTGAGTTNAAPATAVPAAPGVGASSPAASAPGATAPSAPPAKAANPRGAGRPPSAPAGSTKQTLSPIALPPKGTARTHKKLP
jgi:hypothetical protein